MPRIAAVKNATYSRLELRMGQLVGAVSIGGVKRKRSTRAQSRQCSWRVLMLNKSECVGAFLSLQQHVDTLGQVAAADDEDGPPEEVPAAT